MSEQRRVSRLTLWSLTRGRRVLLLGLCLATITFLLAMIGWLASGAGVADAFYRTLLAFTGDPIYLPEDGALHPTLHIARFTGFATTFVALFGVIGLAFSTRIQRWAAARRSGHAVLVGPTPFGLERIAREHHQITVIGPSEVEIAPTPGLIHIDADPDDPDGAGRLMGAPGTVLFGARSASRNVARARALAPKMAGAEVMLRVEDISLVRDLGHVAPELSAATPVSSAEMVAEALVLALAAPELAEIRGQPGVHAVLVGLGTTGLAVAEQLAATCHHPSAGERLRITVIDCDAKGAEDRVESQSPGLREVAEVTFEQMDGEACLMGGCTERLRQIEAEHPVTAIMIATGDDARNATIAMRLRQVQLERLIFKAPILVRNRMRAGRAPAPIRSLAGGIHPFGGDRGSQSDPQIHAFEEALAEAQHTRWVARAQAEWKAGLRTDRPLPWEELTSAQRRSPLLAARAAPHLLRAVGLVPDHEGALGMRMSEAAASWANGHKETLKRLEHERWAAEKTLDGWRPAPRRDDERKLHDALVGWDELSDGDRAKDFDNVDLLIETCEGWTPDEPSWRRLIRVGVMGPMEAKPGDADRVAARFAAHLADWPHTISPEATSLEIVTPDAPGFDRVAAAAIARTWREKTGRTARVLAIRAGGPAVLADKAVEHLIGTEANEEDAKRRRVELLHEMSRQAEALRDASGMLRVVDMRPPSVSNADLRDDSGAFSQAVDAAAARVDSLSDVLVWGARKGVGAHSRRIAERRDAAVRSSVRIDLD